MKYKLLILLFIISLSGCNSFRTIDSNTAIDIENESIFIIGVSPDNYKISVFPGNIKDEYFVQNPWRPAAVYSSAKDGYVVGKGTKNDVLAITNIRVVKDKDSIFGPDFGPCEGNKTMVFEMPAGKAIYLGDIQYQYNDKKLDVKTSNNYEAAKKYIDNNFPDYRGKLEQWDYQMLAVQESCTNTIYYYPPSY